MPARIVSLHIYPIKSCAAIDLRETALTRAGLAHDRCWMLVDAQGRFLTQRQYPRMAQIRTGIDAAALRLTAPGMEPLAVPLDGSELSEASELVGVWSDTILAQAESARAHDWFSRFMGLSCRLLKVDAQARRSAGEKDWVARWRDAHPDLAESFAGDHVFGFADGYPVLVVNQASLDALNERLVARGKSPVPMDRFRPNIVVQGDDWQAFDEDHTATVQAGPATLALVKPCTRCPMPNVDQRTGEPGDEPGPTLAALHTLEAGVVFGMNAIVAQTEPLVLKAGDPVGIELNF